MRRPNLKQRWLHARGLALNTPSPELQQPVSARPLTQPQPYAVMPGEYVDPPYQDEFDPDDLLDMLEDPQDTMILGRYGSPNVDPASLEVDALLGEVDQLLGADDESVEPADVLGSVRSRRGLLPIFDPAHNLREASKQMLLLEDHLFHPDKRCNDCIRKHLLTAEALAEEAVSLDKEGQWQRWTHGLPEQYRSWLGALEQDGSANRKEQVANRVRQVRKALVKDLARVRKSVVSRRGSKRMGLDSDFTDEVIPTKVPDLAARLDFQRVRRQRLGEAAAAPASVQVSLADGTVWLVRSNKRIEQVKGPIAGDVLSPSDGALYESVVEDLSKADPTVLRVLGRSSAPTSASVSSYARGLVGKQGVIFADRSGGGVVWRRGEAASVGETVAGYKVTSIPQDGWVAVWSKEDDKWMGQWVKTPDVVAAPKGKAASSVFRNKVFPLYLRDGRQAGRKLKASELAMVDLVQSVLSKTLVDGSLPVQLPADVGARTLDNVIAAALVNAGYESFFDPNAVGDGGKSVGLFQLHEAGAGRGMSVEARKNPIKNTERISKEFFQAANTAGTDVNKLVMQSARAKSAGELPSAADWAYAWTVDVEKPYERKVQGGLRAKTAADFFGKPRVTRVATGPAAPGVTPVPAGLVPAAKPAAMAPATRQALVLGGVTLGALLLGAALVRGTRPMQTPAYVR